MKKLLGFILIICVCLGFVVFKSTLHSKSNQSTLRSDLTTYDDLTLKISHEVDQKLKNEIPELHPCGWGGQINGGQVIFRAFQIPGEVDEKSGRDLILKITNAYLEAFNASEEFRPYIRDYPFTNRNFEIILFFGPVGTIPSGQIHIVSLMDGTIQYKADNPNDTFEHKGKTMYRLMTLHEETYEDALDKATNPMRTSK